MIKVADRTIRNEHVHLRKCFWAAVLHISISLYFPLKLKVLVVPERDIYLPFVVVVLVLDDLVTQSETITANAKPPVSTPSTKPRTTEGANEHLYARLSNELPLT